MKTILDGVASTHESCSEKNHKKPSYVVGRQLPDKLPKKAEEFLAIAVTPKRAFEIAAKVERIAAKNRPESSSKQVHSHQFHNA